MTRIEKTQVNISAFIMLSSKLGKVQSDRIIEIVDNGKGIKIRPKEEHEKEEFSIDLSFLKNQLFAEMVKGGFGTMVLTGEAEQYLKNCSFACYYYRNETEPRGEFDHFDLFHNIHFVDSENIIKEEDILRKICGLFRVDFNNCLPFTNCEDNFEGTVNLPPKKAFNQIFQTIKISQSKNSKQIVFESYPLDMTESLDALFTLKDLLFCRGINTEIIPEYSFFSIQEDEEVIFPFKIDNRNEILISFKYKGLKIEINKNCV